MLWYLGRAAGLAVALALAVCAQTALTEEQKLEFLRTAELRSAKTSQDGLTGTTRATLALSDLAHEASIQTINITPMTPRSGSPPEPGFTDRYAYNIAAYELDCILHLHMIPATVLRSYRGDPASYTWWVDGAMMTEKERFLKKLSVPDNDAWNKQMYILRVFDQLIYNMDRNLGNVVIDKEWKLWMIDHTRAFRPWKKIKSNDDLTKCDRQLLARLRALDAEEVHKRMAPYITKTQADALVIRAQLIVKRFDEVVKKKGEGEVLYDYLPTQ